MSKPFEVRVFGRPAPQGSKKTGAYGQMREASVYLPAWRAAVKKAVYERYLELGIEASQLPLIRGAIALGATFYLDPKDVPRIDGKPDLDKLLRALMDCCTAARLYEDDARVVDFDWLNKLHAGAVEKPGVFFAVRGFSEEEG